MKSTASRLDPNWRPEEHIVHGPEGRFSDVVPDASQIMAGTGLQGDEMRRQLGAGFGLSMEACPESWPHVWRSACRSSSESGKVGGEEALGSSLKAV
ncbi:hypothetical protein MKX08_006953 [Trichoderma sp. CBMAI-0020]|nr:hypothetical protein MKX08_006953 [Trichoderma sp. CBMAI-0020]